jgi:hypothetical protein
MKRISNILIVLLIVLTSASVSSIITSKPAQPKWVVVKHFEEVGGFSEQPRTQVPRWIREMRKKGWILKTISGGSGHSHEAWFVVMEKY